MMVLSARFILAFSRTQPTIQRSESLEISEQSENSMLIKIGFLLLQFETKGDAHAPDVSLPRASWAKWALHLIFASDSIMCEDSWSIRLSWLANGVINRD